MKSIHRFLYKVEYSIKRMNPATRRIYIVLLLFAVLLTHLTWETWQSRQSEERFYKIEQENEALRLKIDEMDH